MSSAVTTVNLGGDAKDWKVGRIGHGLMMLTWLRPTPTPDEEAFESMIAAIEAGATYWNSGTFYNPPDQPMANLKLLNRFFTKYPQYADEVFLSVKGGLGGLTYDKLKVELTSAVEALGPNKKIDLFQCARQMMPVEETIPSLKKLIDEGFFTHIGLSEVGEATVRKAAALHPIAAVEVECSIWSLEPELYKVINATSELGISLIGYSPLGRGFLTGQIKSIADLEGDERKKYPRFQPEVFDKNLELVAEINRLSEKKGVTPAQFCLAYLLQMSPNIIPIPGSSNKTRTLENIKAAEITLTAEDVKSVDDALKQFEIVGGRYPDAHGLSKMVWL